MPLLKRPLRYYCKTIDRIDPRILKEELRHVHKSLVYPTTLFRLMPSLNSNDLKWYRSLRMPICQVGVRIEQKHWLGIRKPVSRLGPKRRVTEDAPTRHKIDSRTIESAMTRPRRIPKARRTGTVTVRTA